MSLNSFVGLEDESFWAASKISAKTPLRSVFFSDTRNFWMTAGRSARAVSDIKSGYFFHFFVFVDFELSGVEDFA